MAALEDRNGKAVRATIRIKGYPQKTKTFRYADHGGKRKAYAAAKDWATGAELALKKLDPATMRRGKTKTFLDVIDVYLQTRCGFRLNDEMPRDAWKTFKRDRSNACVPLGDKEPITGRNLNAPISHLSWWNSWFDGKPLSKITAEHVIAGLDFLNDGKRRPATVNRYQSYLHAAFELVVRGRRNRNEWIETNPCPLGKLREDNRRNVVLTTRQQKRLLTACAKSENSDLSLIVQLGIATGARQSNIMELRWDRIDLRTGRVDIPGEEMKNGKRFATLIRGEALDMLKRRRKQLKLAKVQNLYNGQFVFPSKQTDGPADFPRKAWATALRQAKIVAKVDPLDPRNTGFHFHDLRHTFATKLAAKGATQPQLQKAMGHSSPQMTARYVKIDLDDVAHLFE